jgi:uncharacterized membrane protein
VECSGCGRSFIQPAFERHSRICAKVFGQKRKAFDMAAKRMEALEAAAGGGGGGGGGRGGGRGGAAGRSKAAAVR